MSRVLIDLTMLSVDATRTRGIGRYVADLARAVGRRATARGLEVFGVERLDWTRASVITPDLERAVARLHADPMRSQAAWAYRARLRMAAAVRRAGAMVLHSPDADATPIGLSACARIVTCHDLIHLAFPMHYSSWRDGWATGRRWLDRRRYSTADHVVAVSETTARDLNTILGIPPEKITVVRHGIDLARFSSARRPHDRQRRDRYGLDSRAYLLYFGGGDWRKNAEGMLEALTIARQRDAASDLVLVWAGRLSPAERARVEHLAELQKVRPALHLLGWIPDEDLWALVRGAVALLFVSRAEGFGYPIVEAMASGCPVIAADTPSSAEICGQAAWLVDPDRPDMMADAARVLMRDGERRCALVERGLARARLFDVNRMADETLDVYQRVGAFRASLRLRSGQAAIDGKV